MPRWFAYPVGPCLALALTACQALPEPWEHEVGAQPSSERPDLSRRGRRSGERGGADRRCRQGRLRPDRRAPRQPRSSPPADRYRAGAATGRAQAARPCLRDDHRRSPARPGRVPRRAPGGCRRARRGPRLAKERLARLGALRADRRRDARQWRRDHRRRPGSRAKARRVRAGSAGLAQQLRAAHRARPELRHRAHRRSARRAGRCLLRPGAAGGPGRDVPGPARRATP